MRRVPATKASGVEAALIQVPTAGMKWTIISTAQATERMMRVGSSPSHARSFGKAMMCRKASRLTARSGTVMRTPAERLRRRPTMRAASSSLCMGGMGRSWFVSVFLYF